MRKITECTLETESGPIIIELRELTVGDILKIGEELGKGSLLDDIESLLPRVSNLTLDIMHLLTPSELEDLWNAFREVNASFFKIAEALGFGTLLESGLTSLRAGMVRAVMLKPSGELS